MIVITTMKELPKNCTECPCLLDSCVVSCAANHYEFIPNIKERPEWCPLKEVQAK